jgi:hypothetical protein
MDTMKAFVMGETNRDKEPMVFDWEQAAQMIVERKAQSASAGLAEDWEWTGGPILKDGIPIPKNETYVYLASTWARPLLEIDGVEFPCFRMKSQSPGWDEKTYWPQEALNILNGPKKE